VISVGLARLIIQQNAATAIDLDVDEAGREDRVGGKCCYAMRRRLSEADAFDEATRNRD
jgi:hypothetical protein